MDAILELQNLREELIREIDGRISLILKNLESESERVFETIYPLNAGTAVFKGKRPTGIIFADGVRKDCPTWKRVVAEILKECCSDEKRHQALIDMCDKVQGRKRVLLGSDDSKMHSPLKIDDSLYIETHYDAETLLYILTTRILDMVGYDYGGIKIAVRA